jgi:[ribosomal protein S5]-alanine N-acetyltransferase
MIIQLDRCTLRRWQAGDEASLAEHANNYKIWLNVRDYFPHPYTPADARNWIAYASNQRPLTNFAIVIDSLAVGGIGVVLKEDIYRRSAEIGYWLGEPYWNRGIMSEAVPAVTGYAFSHFDICRIYAGIFDYNEASQKVLAKAGYSYEARLKKSLTKNNQTYDEIIYALIRE